MMSVKWHHLRVLRGCLDACPERQVRQGWFVLELDPKQASLFYVL